jgi:hypothetical protein
MKLLIIATDKQTLNWSTLPAKICAIKTALNKTNNAIWEIEVIYKDLVPKLNSQHKIDYDWYNDVSYPYFRQGNHFIYILFSGKQWVKYGLDKGLRGVSQNDTDFVGEAYGWADEHTTRKDTKLNQMVQTTLHEMSHELARSTNVPDKTHEYHSANRDILGIFSTYDMRRWQPVYQAKMKEIGRLQKILSTLTAKPKPLQHFFPLHKTLISQGYGVANSVLYPRTGHHIGTDYMVPENTPILAPGLCAVTKSGNDKALGNWCEIHLNDVYLIFAHLRAVPSLGLREAGQVIGFSGNTGLSTGPHCHVEGWHESRDVTKLTKDNFRQFTFDVTSLIK